MQRDLVAGILRDMHPEMHGIGSARGDQAHINGGARRPCVPLVDHVAVLVNLQRAVEVRSGFDWPFAIVLDHAAPEDDLALVVGGLQFQPGVVGVDSATGEKVADLYCADDHDDSYGDSAAQYWLNTIERSCNR